MLSSVLLLAAGLALGVPLSALAIHFFLKSRRRTGAALLEAARTEQQRLLADGVKTAGVVEGKRAALKIREDLEAELRRGREEVDRASRRVEEAEQVVG